MTRPTLATFSCDDCTKYIHKEGVIEKRGVMGLPIARPARMPTPCYACPKIPSDEPIKSRDRAQVLSERNANAYWHYLECKAVSSFPADAIVRRNAAIIRDCEETVGRRLITDRLDLISSLLGAK